MRSFPLTAQFWCRPSAFWRSRCVLARQGKTGVIWPNNRDIEDLLPHLGKLAVVALVFPVFRDGRAYTQARLLRERHGYDGELRATGQVLRDSPKPQNPLKNNYSNERTLINYSYQCNR